MDFLKRMAGEWAERAPALAEWTMNHLVNRTDVWGRYVHKKNDAAAQVVTVPFRDARGKVFLDLSSLRKHFKTRQPGGQLSMHGSSSDLTSRWLAVDIDLHDRDESSTVTAAGNLAAARAWHANLAAQGLDSVLLDSNGVGGFHLLTLFAEPMATLSVHEFGQRLIADFERLALDRKPEIYPGKPAWDHYGDMLRLPGRHHTRPHYTRVWNDEPYAESPWLEGHDAIDRLLATRLAPATSLEQVGIVRARRTICLDFDGVLHSYRSGWCGSEVIPDPPIHGTRESVARLRQQYRVVVHSARCHTEAGRRAVHSWLTRHDIVVDEVCEHKPPAHVYVDDRAVRFRGDWDDLLDEVRQFRR